MKRRTSKIVAVLITTVFAGAINASALDFIATNGNWQKKECLYSAEEQDTFMPAIGDMLADSAGNYSEADDFYNIDDGEMKRLYASEQFHQSNTVSSLIETNLNRSDDGSDFGRLHKYLGYGTVLLAGMAAVSGSYRSLHYGSAYAATGTGLAACLTGYMEYGDRFDLEDGLFSEDNLHIMLGVLGTIGLITAVAIEGTSQSSHSGIGGAGGASMLLSVITIRW